MLTKLIQNLFSVRLFTWTHVDILCPRAGVRVPESIQHRSVHGLFLPYETQQLRMGAEPPLQAQRGKPYPFCRLQELQGVRHFRGKVNSAKTCFRIEIN